MGGHPTSAAWIQGIVDMLADVGLDVATVLAEAGINHAMLANPHNRAPTELVAACGARRRNISAIPPSDGSARMCPSPAISTSSDTRCCRVRACALRLKIRAAFAAGQRRRFDRSRFQGRVGHVAFAAVQRVEAHPPPEFDLLTLLTSCRWVAGKPIQPLGLYLVWPAPADIAPFESAFQCSLHFEADFDGIRARRYRHEAAGLRSRTGRDA